MTFSPESEKTLRCYLTRFPWIRYVSRSHPDRPGAPGAVLLHEEPPRPTERGGFCPAARCEELPPEFLPELPEGVCVKIEEAAGDGKDL